MKKAILALLAALIVTSASAGVVNSISDGGSQQVQPDGRRVAWAG